MVLYKYDLELEGTTSAEFLEHSVHGQIVGRDFPQFPRKCKGSTTWTGLKVDEARRRACPNFRSAGSARAGALARAGPLRPYCTPTSRRRAVAAPRRGSAAPWQRLLPRHALPSTLPRHALPSPPSSPSASTLAELSDTSVQLATAAHDELSKAEQRCVLGDNLWLLWLAHVQAAGVRARLAARWLVLHGKTFALELAGRHAEQGVGDATQQLASSAGITR
ncbi:hypothetical protein T492DRAFT_1144777 [Pavlovales sp. CCMP2436]|nr:hypothetical protein T492DRAFT_1144777 [Pavlovales sp. CCMP2436]